MKLNKINLLLLFLITTGHIFSQNEPIEIYLIDAYCTREIPHKFKLSFYTSELAKSKVLIEDEYKFDVAAELTELHKAEIEIEDLSFKDNIVEFIIITETEEGRTDTSEVFDFDLPYEPNLKGGSDVVTICLFAGAIFLLPYPNLIFNADNSFFSLTKEIPVVSFRTKGNYPSGYLSLEYTYVFDSDAPSYLRSGYKKIFALPHIEYISPGVSLYTNFSGNYGISPEISIGLFTIKDTFTFYARYRYNLDFTESDSSFNEISIGFYSAFFSLYL